ncbi:MAG TPA: hypothetical protein VFW41_03090 [Gaiellaceae bacterium]|nr:hypothetical protein [Gaiellaceae bacterium]
MEMRAHRQRTAFGAAGVAVAPAGAAVAAVAAGGSAATATIKTTEGHAALGTKTSLKVSGAAAAGSSGATSQASTDSAWG